MDYEKNGEDRKETDTVRGKKAARRRKMTGILLSYLIILTLAGCGNEQTRPDRNSTVSSGSEQKEQATYQEVLEGDSAPDFTAEAADGSTFVLSEQKGKVVLLNFWATWCGPVWEKCRHLKSFTVSLDRKWPFLPLIVWKIRKR